MLPSIAFKPAFADITIGAGIAYRSNTGTALLESPKFRMYDNAADTWGSEVELSDTGSNVRDVRLKCSPTTAKCVIVSLSLDGTLNSWVCTSSCGTASSWTDNFGADFADLWTTEPTGSDRPFDMAYEDQSGDLMIVYDKVSTVSGEELFYRIMTSAGTTFGSETAINTQTADSGTDRVYPYVKLASDDGSDKIGGVSLDDSNTDVNAMIWSGTAWGDHASVTTASSGNNDEQIGIAWETNSGHLLVTGGAGADIGYREYTTSWQTASTIGGVATGVGTVNWISMKSTPRAAGNEIFLAFSGALNDFASIQWSGTAWGTGTEHDATIDGTDITRVFDIALSPAADGDSATVDALLMWGTTANQIDYRSWSATNTYGTAANIANTGTHLWVLFPDVANPTSGDNIDSIGGTKDSDFDISRLEWTGGANAPTDLDDEVSIDTVANTWEGHSIDWFYQTFTTAYTTNISDTATFTESRVSAMTKVISDTGTFTESTAETITKALTETTTFTESIVKDMAKVLTETSTWTESIAAGLLITLNLADTATFTETESMTFAKALSETGTFTEALVNDLMLGGGGGASSGGNLPIFPELPDFEEIFGPADLPTEVVGRGATYALVPHELQNQTVIVQVKNIRQLTIYSIDITPSYDWIKPKFKTPYVSSMQEAETTYEIQIPVEVVVPEDVKERMVVNMTIHALSSGSPTNEITATVPLLIGDPYNNSDIYFMGGVIFAVIAGVMLLRKRRHR